MAPAMGWPRSSVMRPWKCVGRSNVRFAVCGSAAKRASPGRSARGADERISNLPALDKPPARTAILLVEDDPDQAALAELRLTMAGYRVRSVDRAKALSRYLREEARPDLLLLDVMLPDGDGFTFFEELKAERASSPLPVVFISARSETSAKVRAQRASTAVS